MFGQGATRCPIFIRLTRMVFLRDFTYVALRVNSRCPGLAVT